MKVLFVCKYKRDFPDNMIPFNRGFVNALRKHNVDTDVYLIKDGWLSYLKGIVAVAKLVKLKIYDVVHASYGLSGFVISFQRKTPSVVTFVGSDLYNRNVRFLSKNFVLKRITRSVFVSQNLFALAGQPSNGVVIPFGVDFEKFYPVNQNICREELGMDTEKIYVLFAGRFDRTVKNSPLAFEAIKHTRLENIELVELKNIPENKINAIFNACDICLMTSFSEGSPQFIKEAMACNKPIVSTDVGDVKQMFGDVDGHYVSSYDPEEMARLIDKALEFQSTHMKTKGRERLREMDVDFDSIINRVQGLYNTLIPVSRA